MTTLEANKSKNSSGITRSGRLFVLELSEDCVHSMNSDGSDRKTIVTDCHPKGHVVDACPIGVIRARSSQRQVRAWSAMPPKAEVRLARDRGWRAP